MKKIRQISIKIIKEQYDFVKDMDGSFTKIWEIGFERWAEEFPEYLQQKSKKYDSLYKQCIFKLEKIIKNKYSLNKELNQLVKEYISNGRSVENPSIYDKNWIKSRITKLNGINIEKFYYYARGILEESKQKQIGE